VHFGTSPIAPTEYSPPPGHFGTARTSGCSPAAISAILTTAPFLAFFSSDHSYFARSNILKLLMHAFFCAVGLAGTMHGITAPAASNIKTPPRQQTPQKAAVRRRGTPFGNSTISSI
jgi:hypothetical protein